MKNQALMTPTHVDAVLVSSAVVLGWLATELWLAGGHSAHFFACSLPGLTLVAIILAVGATVIWAVARRAHGNRQGRIVGCAVVMFVLLELLIPVW